MSIIEPTMIGLSEKTYAILNQMKEDNYLAETADGYRLGIGLALAQGGRLLDVPSRRTVFSVATIDPDREIAAAIRALMDLQDGSVYRMAEKLAEWGVIELANRFDCGPIDIASLLPSKLSNN